MPPLTTALSSLCVPEHQRTNRSDSEGERWERDGEEPEEQDRQQWRLVKILSRSCRDLNCKRDLQDKSNAEAVKDEDVQLPRSQRSWS